jgi:L-arabinose isomerase
MGNRFRLVVNKVDVILPDQPLPRLPVARALWIPQPDLDTAAAAWILAGGAHHTSFAQSLSTNTWSILRKWRTSKSWQSPTTLACTNLRTSFVGMMSITT